MVRINNQGYIPKNVSPEELDSIIERINLELGETITDARRAKLNQRNGSGDYQYKQLRADMLSVLQPYEDLRGFGISTITGNNGRATELTTFYKNQIGETINQWNSEKENKRIRDETRVFMGDRERGRLALEAGEEDEMFRQADPNAAAARNAVRNAIWDAAEASLRPPQGQGGKRKTRKSRKTHRRRHAKKSRRHRK